MEQHVGLGSAPLGWRISAKVVFTQAERSASDECTACNEGYQLQGTTCYVTLEGQQGRCVQAKGVVDSTEAACIAKNETLQQLSCSYSVSLNDACQTLDTCRSNAETARAATYASVRIAVESQKAALASLEKATCFMELLSSASQKNFTWDDYRTCTEMNPNTDAFNVTYPDIVAAPVCDLSPAGGIVCL